MKRRTFIKAGINAGAMAAMMTVLPLASRAAGVRRYAITAAPAVWHLGQADRPATDLWLYGGTSPGPMIEAVRGEELEVEFQNNLQVPTTMHWHGIRNLNEMDGVPDLTSLPSNQETALPIGFRCVTQGRSGTTPITRAGNSWRGGSTGR